MEKCSRGIFAFRCRAPKPHAAALSNTDEGLLNREFGSWPDDGDFGGVLSARENGHTKVALVLIAFCAERTPTVFVLHNGPGGTSASVHAFNLWYDILALLSRS